MKYIYIFISVFVFIFIGCDERGSSSGYIKVDQFGYLPNMEKIAVISNPQSGYNSSDSFSPSGTLLILDANDDSKVFTGSITSFNDGTQDTQSGDKLWYFDFSSFTSEGVYYIYDPEKNSRSNTFSISSTIYEDILEIAVKTFFYQRAGYAKTTPYVSYKWADGASHLGTDMDDDCKYIEDDSDSRDLSGGWYDAGDFNKYINYADGAIHNLLLAYEENPTIWGDDYGIPESSNGIPDLLDEIMYELDWMLKMQKSDGSVLHKVSSINFDATTPPSTDTVPRKYAAATASATISAIGTFAHAAIVFADINSTYASTLQSAAINAWTWINSNSSTINETYDNVGFVNASAEDTVTQKERNLIAASIYLFALTNDSTYHTYFKNNYTSTLLMDSTDGGYLQYDGTDEEVQNALLYYTTLTDKDTTISSSILSTYESALSNQYVDFAPILQYENNTDGYLSYIDTYYWGSNRAKSQAGSVVMNARIYDINNSNDSTYYNLSANYLHYIHGLNPINIVYLSNMSNYGAEKSVDEFYHMWFRDESDWDNVNSSYGPPPGFLVGGANENYDISSVYMENSSQTIENQPAAKSYRSWNTEDDESYRITENSITYQAAYIRLLSKFVE